MILRQLGANGGVEMTPFHTECALTGDVRNRVRSKGSFLLQIDAKLFDPTFLNEKVGPDNFWLGLRIPRVLFSLARLYDSLTEPAINPSCFEA